MKNGNNFVMEVGTTLAMLGIHGLGPIRMFHLTERLAGPRGAIGILLIIILLVIAYHHYRRQK